MGAGTVVAIQPPKEKYNYCTMFVKASGEKYRRRPTAVAIYWRLFSDWRCGGFLLDEYHQAGVKPKPGCFAEQSLGD